MTSNELYIIMKNNDDDMENEFSPVESCWLTDYRPLWSLKVSITIVNVINNEYVWLIHSWKTDFMKEQTWHAWNNIENHIECGLCSPGMIPKLSLLENDHMKFWDRNNDGINREEIERKMGSMITVI